MKRMAFVLELLDADARGARRQVPLSAGSHVLGRGPVLRIVDPRISRAHIMLDLHTTGASFLTGCGRNCAVSVDGKVAKNGERLAVSHGTSFALLQQHGKYTTP